MSSEERAQKTMNPRHAVPLALIGWYIMVPPTNLTGVQPSEPLSKWLVYRDYDSLPTCLAAETELHRRGRPDPEVTPTLQFPSKQLRQFAKALCVASDDLRLKSN